MAAEADAPRSSVYRVWGHKREFLKDLLMDLADAGWPSSAVLNDDTIALTEQIIKDHRDQLETPAGRRSALLESVRRGAAYNLEAIYGSPNWKTYITMNATILSIDDDDKFVARLREALNREEENFLTRMVGFYATTAAVLGLKIRSPYTFEHIAISGAALMEGLALRKRMNERVVDTSIVLEQSASDGAESSTPWSLGARGFLAIIDTMVEPDESFIPPSAVPFGFDVWFEQQRIKANLYVTGHRGSNR